MNTLTVRTILVSGFLCVFVTGCQEHILKEDMSLEDAAKALIDQSAKGKGIYGGDLVRSETLSANSIRWTARWDFMPHGYEIEFDSVLDRGIQWRAANMSIRDTIKVSLSLLPEADPVVEKSNYAVARTSALLVQYGKYGYAYHGWELRKVAHRLFRGPGGISPSLIKVTVERGQDSWVLSTGWFSIDDVPLLAKGNSVTVRVKTSSPSDILFLNVGDAGTIIRRLMVYDNQKNEHVAQWRVSSSAGSKRYYQAFVEAYSKISFIDTDSAAVGVAGHTFVYRIK